MIDLGKNQQKRGLFVMNPLYQNGLTIKRLRAYFAPYFAEMTRPTADNFFFLLLAIISIQGIQSIRFLYTWFLKRINASRHLNSYYYLLSEGKMSRSLLNQVTVRIALSCIPKECSNYPIFLIIDDTLQPKYGTHFEEYQLMFDHACHNGSNYLKGHCFVGLVISVPVEVEGKLRYLSVPVGYRLRSKNENKLELAANMVEQAIQAFPKETKAILLCDSWYPKGAIRMLVSSDSQLELIANVRVDTALYDLPPAPTGKRGRPAKKGSVLNYQTDFELHTQIGDYMVGTRKVITNLFPDPVYATVTTYNSDNASSYRIFISTIMPEDILLNDHELEILCPELPEADRNRLLPYCLYGFRWAIEVVFYEQKTFWSFGKYMVRTKNGIESYVNFLAIAYSCVQLLPFKQEKYAHLRGESSQVKKQLIGMAIQQEVFFYTFVLSIENRINSLALIKAFEQWIEKKHNFL